MQDKRVHGGVTLGPIIQEPHVSENEKMKKAVIAEDMSVDIVKMGTNIGASASIATSDMKTLGVPNVQIPVGEPGLPTISVFIPEGRVHGGSLMAMLASGSGIGSSSSQIINGDSSESRKSYMMPQSWV